MRLGTLFTAVLAVGLAAGAAAAGTDYDGILERADEARGNLGGVAWDVLVNAVEGGRTNTRAFAVQALGFNVLAETVAPSKRKGNKLLMVDGNMWFYKPDLSKPVPVSRRQKLMGRAANGDIASTNYAEDYETASVTNGVFNGESCYVYDLKAKSRRTTYSRIKYWISTERVVGVKAEYYTVSGKLLKNAVMGFDNEVQVGTNQPQPFISRMVIRDELMTEDETTMQFANPKLKDISHHVFNLNLLVN